MSELGLGSPNSSEAIRQARNARMQRMLFKKLPASFGTSMQISYQSQEPINPIAWRIRAKKNLRAIARLRQKGLVKTGDLL